MAKGKSDFDLYQHITDQVLALIDQGLPPWRVPWNNAGGTGIPRRWNGKPYNGINVFLLLCASLTSGYREPYWLTYKQTGELGGHVKKGEKSTMIVYWRTVQVRDKHDPDGKRKVTVPMLRYYRVFNLDQCEGVTMPRKIQAEQAARERAATGPMHHDPIMMAEDVVAGYPNAPEIILQDDGTRAFYRWSTDVVTVPNSSCFPEMGEFYSTLFHELGHSTGHESRLDRDTNAFPFGSHPYGREELVAEMTAAFLCAESGIETTLVNSAAYLDNWRRKISEDKKMLVWAAGRAQKAADHIMGRKASWEQEDGQEERAAA